MSSIPLPNTPGIYQITCVPTGKIYVGSAVNLQRRWREHCNDATNGNHRSPQLQHAWNKHGADAFCVQILELCDRDQLIDREQHYLDTLRPYDRGVGFNTAKTARSVRVPERSPEFREKMRLARLGRKASEATLAKQRAYRPTDESREKNAAAHRGKPLSAEHRAKLSAAGKGVPDSTETVARRAAANRGKKRSETAIAKQRNRKHPPDVLAKISATSRGRIPSDETRAKIAQAGRGRVASEETRNKIAALKREYHAQSRHCIIHIESGESCIVHLKTFCETHQLTYKTMLATISGRVKQHRGYRVERVPTY